MFLILTAWVPAVAAAPVVTTYRGICDASAAVALDAEHFLVGEDEHNLLKVYRRGTADPVGEVDLIDFLGTRKPSGKIKEADLEGAARIGTRIYWISSHGLDKDGDVEETRYRFFATDVVAGSVPPTVKFPATPPYKKLLDDLLAAEKPEALKKLVASHLAEGSKLPPKDAKGLNIEGLAAMPDGGLLIGFRGPRPNGEAILVPLINPEAVIGGTARAAFADPFLLDLGQRGVRSIDRIGERCVIVAGPFDKVSPSAPGGDFAVFTWSGARNEKPKQIVSDLGGLNPEGVHEIPGTKDVHILSDDGDEEIDGEKCKDLAAEKRLFRAMTITLQ
jgi:hypothetical protein